MITVGVKIPSALTDVFFDQFTTTMAYAALSFTQKILSAELVLCCSALHLFDLQIFFCNYASKSKKGKISRWNKHAGHPADLSCKPVF